MKSGDPEGRTALQVGASAVSHFSRVWLFWGLKDCNLTSSSVHGILQARILESVATYYSRGSSQPSISYVSCIDRRVFLFIFFFLPLAPPVKPIMQVPLDISIDANRKRHTSLASLARSDTTLLLPSRGIKIFSLPGNSLANQRLSQLSQWKPTMFQNPSFLQCTFPLNSPAQIPFFLYKKLPLLCSTSLVSGWPLLHLLNDVSLLPLE